MNIFDKKKENMSCSWGAGRSTSAVVSLLLQIIFSVFVHSDM